MNSEVIAVVVQEGGKILTDILKLRLPRPHTSEIVESYQEPVPELEINRFEYTPKGSDEGASSIEAGCVPCAIGHFGTCSGLLSEGLRFARSGGMTDPITIDRINKCLIELNTMERGDLTESKIVALPSWEKKLAEDALLASRSSRHVLESIATVEQLEAASADIQVKQSSIAKDYFRERISRMSETEKEDLRQKVKAKLKEQGGQNGSAEEIPGTPESG